MVVRNETDHHILKATCGGSQSKILLLRNKKTVVTDGCCLPPIRGEMKPATCLGRFGYKPSSHLHSDTTGFKPFDGQQCYRKHFGHLPQCNSGALPCDVCLLCDVSSPSAVFRVKIFQCNSCDCEGIKKTRVGSKMVKVRTGSQMLVVQTDHQLVGSNLEAARSKGAFIGEMTYKGVHEACSLWFTGVDAGLRSVLAKVRGDLTVAIAQKRRKQCAAQKSGR